MGITIISIFTFIAENWVFILTTLMAIIYMWQRIWDFMCLPTDKKMEELKRRLFYWVTEAEIEWGSKTGALKFSEVYNKFCESYPQLKKWITIEDFSKIVDEVLKDMKEKLENSKIIKID